MDDDVTIADENEPQLDLEYDSEASRSDLEEALNDEESGDEDSPETETAHDEDYTISDRIDVPTAPRETLFLIGGRSSFGRTVRINKKYL